MSFVYASAAGTNYILTPTNCFSFLLYTFTNASILYIKE